jgi:hypothetical protein
MANSKRPRSARKPAAVIRSDRKAARGLLEEFPLFPQGSGRQGKKVHGKLCFWSLPRWQFRGHTVRHRHQASAAP